MKIRALMIDDDEKLGKLLREYLAQHEIVLDVATDPLAGKKRLKKENFQLLILDIMMPHQDGISLCKELRSNGIDIPIIMLTARGETADRILGLEVGADDYLPKPFEPRELAARMHSVIRRSEQNGKLHSASTLSFRGLTISPEKRTAFLDQKDLDLTTAEFELLLLLASHPGKKFTRDEIMNQLNGVDADVFSRSIDTLVSRVRSKLGDTAKKPTFIKTAWGSGYVFLGQADDPT